MLFFSFFFNFLNVFSVNSVCFYDDDDNVDVDGVVRETDN